MSGTEIRSLGAAWRARMSLVVVPRMHDDEVDVDDDLVRELVDDAVPGALRPAAVARSRRGAPTTRSSGWATASPSVCPRSGGPHAGREGSPLAARARARPPSRGARPLRARPAGRRLPVRLVCRRPGSTERTRHPTARSTCAGSPSTSPPSCGRCSASTPRTARPPGPVNEEARWSARTGPPAAEPRSCTARPTSTGCWPSGTPACTRQRGSARRSGYTATCPTATSSSRTGASPASSTGAGSSSATRPSS